MIVEQKRTPKRNGRAKNRMEIATIVVVGNSNVKTGKGGDKATSEAQPKTKTAKCNVFRPLQATQMSKVEKYTLRQLVNTVCTLV